MGVGGSRSPNCDDPGDRLGSGPGGAAMINRLFLVALVAKRRYVARVVLFGGAAQVNRGWGLPNSRV